jgi:DNA polymerase-3 subunit gamma/tau
VSLYRTWRPKSFSDLVGQDAVVRTLRTALSSGKLAHAYLFSGPRGSGKTSAAKILARCINCEHGPTAEPDNTCPNCLAILAGTAIDVLEIDAASNRGIEDIRTIREAVKFAPSSMRAKVYIVDEAHMLTREGANAFLKTLEEPPPHVVFILATTEPEKLPPTILSRCQRYAFRRIPVATMIEQMRTIAAAEAIAIDDGALGAIAYRADGGLRDALTMLEQVAAFADGPVDAATVDAAFGSSGRQFARSLAAAVLGNDAAGALRIVDEASDAGTDMFGLTRATIGEYRHLMVARINPELLARDLSPDDAEAARALAARTPGPKIVRGLRLLGDALGAGRVSGNPRLELETAVLRLAVLADDPSLDALAARIALLEGRLGDAPSAPPSTKPPVRAPAAPPPRSVSALPAEPEPEPAEPEPEPAEPEVEPAEPQAERLEPAARRPSPAPPRARAPGRPPAEAAAPTGEPTLQRVRSLWPNVRTRAESEKMSMRAALSRAIVDELEGKVLTLRLADESMASFLRDNLTILERAVADALGTKLAISVRVDGAPRVARPAGPASAPAVKNVEGESAPDEGLGLLEYAKLKFGGTE